MTGLDYEFWQVIMWKSNIRQQNVLKPTCILWMSPFGPSSCLHHILLSQLWYFKHLLNESKLRFASLEKCAHYKVMEGGFRALRDRFFIFIHYQEFIFSITDYVFSI